MNHAPCLVLIPPALYTVKVAAPLNTSHANSLTISVGLGVTPEIIILSCG